MNEPPIKTQAELDAENRKFHVRVQDFAARYPWLGWVLLLVLAPYLFYCAWRESKKAA